MRQMLIESLLISLAGGVAAIVVLRVVGTSLLALMPAGVPRLCEIHADWRTLFLALLLSFITGALFVLTPALYASALDPNRDLKGWSNQRRTERAAEPLARCSCDAGGGVIGSVADWRRIADSELLRHAASAAGARAERPYHRANLDSHFQ